MTLNEMTLHIADALNLSSAEAKARIARNINTRYKRVTSAIGLAPSRREEVSKVATIGNRYITFSGVEKLESVYRKVGTKHIMLDEITHDEMLELSVRTEPPTKYAVFSITQTGITLMIDCSPTTAFTLYAASVADTTSLSNNDSPAFPESFHDVLIHGVMADEYKKMEKLDYARDCEQDYERRLSDLRMFLAKSAYLEIYAGKRAKADGWWDTSGS